MAWKFHDGGRAAAGFKGKAGDCVCRAISIALELDYREVYAALKVACRPEQRRGKFCSPKKGIYPATSSRLLKELGWMWTDAEHWSELPDGRIIVKFDGHLTAMVDGVIMDTHDSGHQGTREVLGYFSYEGV